ncbi:hypothetical protein BCU71_25435 [Vibrio lentus]|uniref:hypothetical protein n=1 Tax=Vibrio TaxID=662 RepID=UPI0002EE2263|nr:MULTISPECIES: hypothetical protein [Vibrio]OED60267.1 hypothetical protein A165_25295 [Vibrio tasmaniensis ZS-17]PMH25294.1 hypothetical protein BCU71_25435 [Vibrio lentus]
MGGSSKSSNSTTNNTTTNNESNSAAFNGDMSGHVMSGIKDSTINMTDGGAVNKALEAMFENSKEAFSFGEEALNVNEAVTKAAINSNENAINKSLGFVDTVLADALNFGREAMDSAESATDSALGVAKNLSLDSDAATARDANKNMMYTTVAIAVAVAIIAFKK